MGSGRLRIQRSRFHESMLRGVAPNLVKTSYFSGSRDWPRGTSFVLSGFGWPDTAAHWRGVPSGGSVAISKRHVSSENRPHYRNNDYLHLRVITPDDWIGVNQTLRFAYNSSTRGASMQLRFLAYSEVRSEIYAAVEVIGTDKKWVSPHFHPDNRWRWYGANFDLPEIPGLETAHLRLTIGFVNSQSPSTRQSLGLDNVTLSRRQL
jgi:hypothetical protein